MRARRSPRKRPHWSVVVIGDLICITLVVLAIVFKRDVWWITFLAGALALGQFRDMLDRAHKAAPQQGNPEP